MNKLNCCTPIKFDEYPPRPLPPLFSTEDFTVDFTWDVFSNTPRTTLNDEVKIDTTGDTSITETTPSKKRTTSALVLPVGSSDSPTN